MITTLHIKNIGIIEDLSVDFNEGFNVLTGETGAGKTLIIDSLGILAGGRFSKEMIRRGEEYSLVEANWYLPENELAIEGNITISREIYTSGKNTCKINGRLVTVTQLKDFMREMIDIHGQQDSQNMMDPATHIRYLDSYIGEEMQNIKIKYQELFLKYSNIKAELKKNYGDDKEKQRKLDLLQYQLKEIQDADLKEKEEEELENTRRRMLNSEKIVENLQIIENELSENGIDAVNTAIKALEKIEYLDKNYQEKLEMLKTIYYDLQEIERDISCEKEKIDFNEEERNQTETRLDLIYSLKRKYGNTVKEILKYKEEVKQEIETICNLEEYTNRLKEELKKIEEKMYQLAKEMNNLRIKYAKILEEKINQELRELEMPNAKINIKVDWKEEYRQDGLNKVEIYILTNVGEESKPLTKIASGGELSRIMLAIKTVLADVDKVPTMVFDEIDTGISGIAAKAVGQKMKKIAKKHQIFVVTHLAVIAAAGEYNYHISKKIEENKTKTSIKQLDKQEAAEEIARIATGEISKTTIQYAKELISINRM